MINDFDELMMQWEPHERFYKTLYQKKQQGEESYRAFVQSVNRKELESQGIYIPNVTRPFTSFGEITPIFRLDTDIAIWKHSRYTPPYMHAHDYFEIVCVVHGKAIHCIDEKLTFEMKPGDICILPDQTRHSLEVMEDDGFVINIMLKKSTFQYTFFDILSADNMLSSFFQDALRGDHQTAYLYFQTGTDEDIAYCVRKLFLEYYNHRKYYEKMLKSMVVCLFSYLLRKHEKYFVPGEHQLEMEIFRYLKENFTDATLESAAGYFHYNPTYFSRLVRQMTGHTFSDLMREYRMESAARLLRESRLPVGEICGLVGYRNLENFVRTFKTYYKKTPTQYRRECESKTRLPAQSKNKSDN